MIRAIIASYLDDVGVRRVQKAHQLRENLGPAGNRVSGENGGDDGSESVADIGIRISNMEERQGLDVFENIGSDVVGVVLDVGLEQKSSNSTRRWELSGHLRQDEDQVVVVVGNISERLQLLLWMKREREGD